jgi:AraC-like DNA-binding protein
MRAPHDESTSIHRQALRTLVDAVQVVIGRVDTNAEESATLVRALLMRMLRRLPERSSDPPTTNFRVARVLSYLEEQFADATICLASAARHVDVTPPHVDRLLKEHTGLTFLQHLRCIRMRHAERLLLTTTSSIKETAYACGYAGTGSFCRDFKRTHGSAARVWRAMVTLCEASGNSNERTAAARARTSTSKRATRLQSA